MCLIPFKEGAKNGIDVARIKFGVIRVRQEIAKGAAGAKGRDRSVSASVLWAKSRRGIWGEWMVEGSQSRRQARSFASRSVATSEMPLHWEGFAVAPKVCHRATRRRPLVMTIAWTAVAAARWT